MSGTTIGAENVREGRPLQDAALTWHDGDGSVVAIADGHGHHKHFRSDVGAAMAVESAVEELRRAIPRFSDVAAAEAAVTEVGASLVESWVEKVTSHVAANPFTPGDSRSGATAKILRPYGTTVLVAAAVGDVVVLLQIGDGDAVVVSESGRATRPLPVDPILDGRRTSSLSQRDPLSSLRTAVVGGTREEIALVYLCTDGFSTSHADPDGWWHRTGTRLVEVLHSNGFDWVREQLPTWLTDRAQVSEDDTTLAIIARNREPATPDRGL